MSKLDSVLKDIKCCGGNKAGESDGDDGRGCNFRQDSAVEPETYYSALPSWKEGCQQTRLKISSPSEPT